MLTEQENDFIRYWEENRLRKKRVSQQLSVGLPFAVFMVVAIFISIFSGWYRGAVTILRLDGRLILVLLVAVILIVLFIVIFSARHQWDMNEQHYKELMARRENRS
jgi:preprotein translocase subunit Sec61beta